MELKPGTVIIPPGGTLWICGKRLLVDDENGWEFVGVFETEEKAVAACLTQMYFVGPAELNKAFPDERVKWPGAYYPKQRNPEVRLKTLEEHNGERRLQPQEACSSGIACPKCGVELVVTNPGWLLMSLPAQKQIHCPECGWAGVCLA